MQRFEVNGYKCVITDIFIQISVPEENGYIRCIVDDRGNDSFIINRIEPSQLDIKSKHFWLVLKYYEDEPVDSNGRIELYFRYDEDDEFIQSVYMKLDIPQETLDALMNFLEHPEAHEILAQAPVNNVNNNILYNNNNFSPPNDPPVAAEGGSRNYSRKGRKTRKQRRRRSK